MTPAHREILLDALRLLAAHRAVEHRAYAPGIPEARRRIRDTGWASQADRVFDQHIRLYADCAREALDGQPDDGLILEALAVLADVPADDCEDVVSDAARDGWAQGLRLALAHGANVARVALLDCGLAARPPTPDAERVAQRVAEYQARAAAAHARLAAARAA